MTPREAFDLLNQYARGHDAPDDVRDAICTVRDYTVQVEQFCELVLSAVRNADSDRPSFALLTELPKWAERHRK